MSQRDVPTCEIGHWEPLRDGCPVCGPDGPCHDPEYEALIQANLDGKHFRRVLCAVALVMLFLAGLLALTRYDPDAGNRIVIDEPDQVLTPASMTPAPGRIEVCEKHFLPGKQHTLNPHAPPDKQRQEIIKVCAEVLPDGRPPRGPINFRTERKPESIA